MLNPDPYEHSPEEDEAFERMARDQEEYEHDEFMRQKAHLMNVAVCNAIASEEWEGD